MCPQKARHKNTRDCKCDGRMYFGSRARVERRNVETSMNLTAEDLVIIANANGYDDAYKKGIAAGIERAAKHMESESTNTAIKIRALLK